MRANIDLGDAAGAELLVDSAPDDLVLSEAASAGADVGGGGGSISWFVGGEGPETGSGSAGIGSSAEEVSIVMCFVTGGDCRRV